MCSRADIDRDLYLLRRLRQWRNNHHPTPQRPTKLDRLLVRALVAHHQTDRTYRPVIAPAER